MDNQEALLRRKLIKASLVIYLLMTTFSFAALPKEIAIGVLSGGAIALLCLMELKRTLEKAFGYILSNSSKVEGYVIARYYLKFGLVALLLTALIRKGNVSAVGIAVGLFVIPATMIYAAISPLLK